VGAYHFYSLAYSGEIQAKNFVETVPVNDTQLQPAIDLEYTSNSKKRPSKNEFQAELKRFIDITTEKFGQKPILYTTYNFYEDYLYPEFSDYPIWIRDIFSKPNTKVISNWHIWQFNPYGKVEGIDGSVDLNVLKQTKL
jgi:lysozyme